jgi:hypothetical protein
MNFYKELIKKFLLMYFFILKAASDGWAVRYNGNNEFTFSKGKEKIIPSETADFLSKFNYNL